MKIDKALVHKQLSTYNKYNINGSVTLYLIIQTKIYLTLINQCVLNNSIASKQTIAYSHHKQ